MIQEFYILYEANGELNRGTVDGITADCVKLAKEYSAIPLEKRLEPAQLTYRQSDYFAWQQRMNITCHTPFHATNQKQITLRKSKSASVPRIDMLVY